MRLVNFGAGEIVDRLTILSLKILYATEAGLAAEHFRNEQVALLTKLRVSNGISGYLESLLDLATINGALWRAEDEIRAARAEAVGGKDMSFVWSQVAVVQVAFRIQALNDQRAALIETINKLAGDHTGSEKV